MTQYAYFRGRVVPIDEANISVRTQAIHYGTSCFGALRGYWNEDQEQLYVFRPHDHYRRFLDSAKLLMMTLPFHPDDLVEVTRILLQKEGWREDVYIRPLAYKSGEVIPCQLHDVEDEFALFSLPYGSYLNKDKGARLMISSWCRLGDNTIPPRGKIGGAYASSALAKSDALLKGFDEALLLDGEGHVAEGSAENVFILRQGIAVTPSVSSSILEGITRRTVIELLTRALGIPVQERAVDRTEIYLADEAFLCGTGAQIVPVTSVDSYDIGSGTAGAITMKLRDLYSDVVRGAVTEYTSWCLPIYA